MGESEKPFACPSPGCNMSFTNEDHLVVHKKKHDMVLNLGNNGKNTFVADQTPTPTRFIRNCEEVGLFQDLQNVNPFEETFRRAVEDGKTVALSEPEGVGPDDTLHTPHIFPNLPESSTASADPAPSNDPKENESQAPEQVCKSESVPEEEKAPASQEPEPSTSLVVRGPGKLVPKIIQASTNLSINGQEVQLLLKTADGKLMHLSALPFSENRAGATETVKIASEGGGSLEEKEKSGGVSNGRLNFAKMRLKQTLTKNGSSDAEALRDLLDPLEISKNIEKRKDKSCGNSEEWRKQDVLARNRASSMRARAKRKAWIQQLQKAASNANEKNAILQMEIKALRNELTKLRTLLLAHENCPVTKSMEKGAVVSIEAKNASLVQTLISTSHSNISVREKRRNSGETPIAPKMTKISMNPPILPKTSDAKPSIVVNDLSAVKIVDVRSIPKEEMKNIVLVDGSAKKIEFIKSISRQQIIHVNPRVLQIENAASKCTGT